MASAHRGGLAITTHTIPWPTRARVVQLTDLHMGPTTPKAVLQRVADIVQGLDPELVVLTGDYVNQSLFHLDRVTDFVRALPAPCVAVLGNHDHWTSAVRVTEALEAGGAEVLRNASTVRGGITVVGVDDGCTHHDDIARAFEGVDPRSALVLTHDPKTAEAIAERGAPLVLSGHTHAGQIEVPLVTRRIARAVGMPYLRGFFTIGETALYVNAGLGHSLEGLRGGPTRPEIAVFELDPAAIERRSKLEHTKLRA